MRVVEDNAREKHQNKLLWRLSVGLLIAIIVLGAALTGMTFKTVDYVVKKNKSTTVNEESALVDMNGNYVQCASTDTSLTGGTLIARNGTAVITSTPFYLLSVQSAGSRRRRLSSFSHCGSVDCEALVTSFEVGKNYTYITQQTAEQTRNQLYMLTTTSHRSISMTVLLSGAATSTVRDFTVKSFQVGRNEGNFSKIEASPNVPMYADEPNYVILLPSECLDATTSSEGCLSPILQLPKQPVYHRFQSYAIKATNNSRRLTTANAPSVSPTTAPSRVPSRSPSASPSTLRIPSLPAVSFTLKLSVPTVTADTVAWQQSYLQSMTSNFGLSSSFISIYSLGVGRRRLTVDEDLQDGELVQLELTETSYVEDGLPHPVSFDFFGDERYQDTEMGQISDLTLSDFQETFPVTGRFPDPGAWVCTPKNGSDSCNPCAQGMSCIPEAFHCGYVGNLMTYFMRDQTPLVNFWDGLTHEFCWCENPGPASNWPEYFDPMATADDYDRGCKSECFPGNAMVDVWGVGPKRMRDLQYGDRVQVVTSLGEVSYEDVYLFGHRDGKTVAQYVNLQTESAQTLQLSPQHFARLCVSGCESSPTSELVTMRSAYAETVRVGDILQVVDAWGRLSFSRVVAVWRSEEEGLFNPYVRGGDIVVNGVVASVHSAWVLDGLLLGLYTEYLPRVYEVLLWPLYLVYLLIGARYTEHLAGCFGVHMYDPAQWHLHAVGYLVSCLLVVLPALTIFVFIGGVRRASIGRKLMNA